MRHDQVPGGVSPNMRNSPTLTLLLLTALMSLTACSDLERVEVRNEEGVVTERFYRSTTDSLRQGKYETFDRNGKLIEVANYKDDYLDGLRTLYYPDGAKQYEETHVAGKFDGPYRAFYPGGQLQLEGQYVADLGVGTWTGYYADGQKKEEVTMDGNASDGPFREYHPNGKLKAEGKYVAGDREDGELLLYDVNGDLERKMQCDRGVCRTMWQSETATENAAQ